MKNLFFKFFCIGLCAFVSTSSASFIVDLDALPNDPVYLTLEAGDYTATPVAGTFTAWKAWSWPVGDIDDYPLPVEEVPPTFESVGWLNSFTIDDTWYGDGLVYYTPEDALAHAVAAHFTLTAKQFVKFQILDTPIDDNSGGISLKVDQVSSAVPEPATIILLGIGLFGLIGISRKKK